MGKRRSKLLNKTYFQCDLTQYPLKRPLCHFPVWKTAADGAERLTRLGSYANWECVLIDAQNIADGPVCRIILPHRISSGTHACWADGPTVRAAQSAA